METKEKSNGALLGSIVIIIILIIGGIYIFYSKIQELKNNQNENSNLLNQNSK